MISGPINRNISEKFLKLFSVEIGPSGNHPKIIFRWPGSNISEVSQVCLDLGPQEIIEKGFSDDQGTNEISEVVKFIFLKTGPSYNHAKMVFRWSGQNKNIRGF